MKRLILFLALFFLFAPCLKAEEITLTLDEAIAIALRDNRDVLMGAKEVERAKYKIREAWAEVWPSLKVEVSRENTRELAPKPYSTTMIHAGLKQNIFKSGSIINTIKYNENMQEATKALLDKTRLEIVLEVKKAFCTLVLAQDFFSINKNILQNAKEHLAFIQERYKSGQASESDVLALESALETAKKEYEAAANQVESSQALLRSLLYLKEAVAIKPDAQFAYEPQEIIYDKAFLEAMGKRPEIRQYEAEERANKNAVNIARAGNLPSIYATWDSYGGDRFITTTGGAAGKWKNYNVIGLTFSWPIFDGFATFSRIEQAKIDLKQTQFLKEKTVQDIALELKDAYLSLKNSIHSIEAAAQDEAVYHDNLKTAKVKYQQGEVSALDLSDANLKYDIALFNKNQALYDYIISKASFEKATGGL